MFRARLDYRTVRLVYLFVRLEVAMDESVFVIGVVLVRMCRGKRTREDEKGAKNESRGGARHQSMHSALLVARMPYVKHARRPTL